MHLIKEPGFYSIFLLLLLTISKLGHNKQIYVDDICGQITGQKIYLEFGERGTLVAKYIKNNIGINETNKLKRCSVEFITCPSCIVEIKFIFLNISKNCDGTTVFDSCGCDYVWIYEPQFQQVSGNQYCGHFHNSSVLSYVSQTRHVAINFLYSKEYEHAFTLDYSSKRNRVFLRGFPNYGNINNATQQIISSPFFPYFYPTDLNIEHIINCETVLEKCRISLIFTDFQIADSSIIEFFDWNGQRMYVTTGNIFRPPIIVSSGPTLVIRFYANGSSKFGYKAFYSFILGEMNDTTITPFIDCGGYVSNLGGAITMMKMITEGTKLFDCIWIIKPPNSYFHMKTHLYVKFVSFSNFAGNTELAIRQGFTSNEPIVELLKYPTAHFFITKEKEHVVPISQGFYVSLKGLFRPDSYLAIVYAAFNYKDCFSGSDFLCHNLRCISILLNCDGFDHCGDNSDELLNCSENPQDRRRWSKIPNFFFPRINDYYTDLSSTTLIVLLFSCGIVGLIFGVVLLLYRINFKNSNRQLEQQQIIQDNIETINAIFEETDDEVEEEIIIPDDPPDYEAPPNYDDVIKLNLQTIGFNQNLNCNNNRILYDRKCFRCNFSSFNEQRIKNPNQTAVNQLIIPDSPPPAYCSNNSGSNTVIVIGDGGDNKFASNNISLMTRPRPGPSTEFNNLNKKCRNYPKSSPVGFVGTSGDLSNDNNDLIHYFSESDLCFLTKFDHKCWPSTITQFGKLRKSFSCDGINRFI